MRASQVEFQGQGQARSLIFFGRATKNNPEAAESWASHAPVWKAAGSSIFFPMAGRRTGGKTILRASYAHGVAVQQASGRERNGRFMVVFSALALAHLPFEFSVSCCKRECSRRDSNAEPSDP